MNMKLHSEDQAYRIGIGAGQAAADQLLIEIVAAVYTGTTDALDNSCRPAGPAACIVDDAGEYAAALERGWWDGLRARCADIVGRLNASSAHRLPEEPPYNPYPQNADFEGD